MHIRIIYDGQPNRHMYATKESTTSRSSHLTNSAVTARDYLQVSLPLCLKLEMRPVSRGETSLVISSFRVSQTGGLMSYKQVGMTQKPIRYHNDSNTTTKPHPQILSCPHRFLAFICTEGALQHTRVQFHGRWLSCQKLSKSSCGSGLPSS